MNKLSSIIVGILVGAVTYFYMYDVQAFYTKSFPYSWFVSLTGYIIVFIVMVGLFFLARIINNKISNFIISVVVYSILVFILLALFFPGYIFY